MQIDPVSCGTDSSVPRDSRNVTRVESRVKKRGGRAISMDLFAWNKWTVGYLRISCREMRAAFRYVSFGICIRMSASGSLFG